MRDAQSQRYRTFYHNYLDQDLMSIYVGSNQVQTTSNQAQTRTLWFNHSQIVSDHSRNTYRNVLHPYMKKPRIA